MSFNRLCALHFAQKVPFGTQHNSDLGILCGSFKWFQNESLIDSRFHVVPFYWNVFRWELDIRLESVSAKKLLLIHFPDQVTDVRLGKFFAHPGAARSLHPGELRLHPGSWILHSGRGRHRRHFWCSHVDNTDAGSSNRYRVEIEAQSCYSTGIPG